MPDTFNNSKAKRGIGAARVETGVIANVNPVNLTADWVSQYSGKQITDLQIMTPYMHYNKGEGFTCIPEIGAICCVCFPSDDDPPFVMGFLSGPELVGPGVDKFLEDKLVDPEVQGEDDLPVANTTQSGGSTVVQGNPSDASFRGGRPLLNPGDMIWQGRDENFVVLRRGGVLQIGSTNICQRAYIPVLNFIRDFCENYELNTAAGTLSWRVERVENNPEGNAPTEFTLIAREYAQDKKASIKVWVGDLEDAEKPPGGDKTFIELTIAPQQIDPSTGEVTGSAKYVMRIDKAGNSFVMQAKNRMEEINGNLEVTVSGSRTVKVGSDNLTVLGSSDTKITGSCKVQGSTSEETWSISKVLTSPQLLLGGPAAIEPAVLGLKLIKWLVGHTHQVQVTGVTTGPASVTATSMPSTMDAKDVLSKTVKVNQ